MSLSWKGPTIECSTVCPVCQPNPAVADVVVTVIWVLDDLVIHKSCVHAPWNLPCDADVVCWIVVAKIIVLTLSMQINKLNYPGIIFLMKCMFNIIYTSNHSYFTLIINTKLKLYHCCTVTVSFIVHFYKSGIFKLVLRLKVKSI